MQDQKKNASYINRLNKIEVLRLIRESGQTSRAAIVKQSHLSAPTVTRIVDSLIKNSLVSLVGDGDSTGGRPPKMITFKGDSNYVIGIDLGSTNIRAGISNLDGDFITEIETPTDRAGGFEKVIAQLGDLVSRLISRSKLDEKKILGMGVAVAGLINGENGLIEYSPMFKWRQVDLMDELKKHFNLPIFYDNVSRVTALGELLYGIGKRHKNFISVNAGYGIGAGIIINGVRYFGSNGYAGELGHIVVDRNSQFVGKDGIKGCLEALSSGSGIAEIAKFQVEKMGPDHLILKEAGGELIDISAKCVFEAAIKGDQLANEIIDNAMWFFAIGLDTLIKLFDPSAIVISGGLAKNGNFFFDKLEQNLKGLGLMQSESKLALHPSSFNDDATLMGAFSLVIAEVLQLHENVIPG